MSKQPNYKEKICVKCGNVFKPTSSTQKYCLTCGTLKNKYYFNNKDKYNDMHKKWLSENKEQQKIFKHKNYFDNHYRELKRNHEYYNDNKEYFKLKGQKYRKNNKEKIREYRKNKYKNDIEFKMAEKLREWVRRCLNYKKNIKKHTFDTLNYTASQLKQRLESQFNNGMTWENYGSYWHIDHKKPLSLFNFYLPNGEIDYHQIFLANCLANLQPMLAIENLKKNNKFPYK